MKTVKVPLSTRVYGNVDGVELSDDAALLIDGYLDEAGGSNKRPGLNQEVDLGVARSSVDGLYWWSNKGYAVAVSGGRIFRINKSGTSVSATEITGDSLLSDKRVSFATDGTALYMANGGQIVRTTGSTASYVADADAPTVVTHLDWMDGYLLANSGTSGELNRVHFSDPDDNTDWTADDFFSAEGNADDVTAIHTFNREIYIFGINSTEVWENDGVNPFSRIPSGFYDVGCIAPYSIVNTNESLFWLDDTKHFVEMKPGGGLVQLQTDYDKEIQSFSTVTDCISDRIEINGKPFLIFHFPAENRSLCFNYRDETWSEWKQYVGPTSTANRWYGNCYCFCPDWNFHLVGGRHDSLIYTLSPDYFDDDGEEIRMLRRTGHIDFGTSRTKESKELRLRLKRGGGEISGEPVMMMRWKDDNKSWSNEIEISLGKIGEYESPVTIYPRGIYRTRQYEISVTDAVPVIYIDAEEDIEILDR